jgi:guanylate kinase
VSTSNTSESSVSRQDLGVLVSDASNAPVDRELPVSGALDPVGQSGDHFIADLRARRQPRLFVISGPSGVGKDTVIERLRLAFPEMHFAVTATTRRRRPGEIDGVHYFFLDQATFRERLAQGEFLESATVYENLYGVPKGPVRQALKRGQDVIVKVDVQGAATIKTIAPDAIFIFLAPESMDELFARLQGRKSEDPEVLLARFIAADRELRRAHEFNYVVFNERDGLEQAIRQLQAIIHAEMLKTAQTPIVI